MSVKKRMRGDVTVLDLSGEFYGDKPTDDLEQALRDEVEAGTHRLLLNLYQCSMMNSLTLAVLIDAKQKLDAIGSEVRLCGLGYRMKSLLVMNRLIDYFQVHDTETEALAGFPREAASA
jgi:anti-anti-sigma factor